MPHFAKNCKDCLSQIKKKATVLLMRKKIRVCDRKNDVFLDFPKMIEQHVGLIGYNFV
jgi:hypothetical protein